MNPDVNELLEDDVSEAYEHLAFSNKSKPRLKNGLNLKDLMTQKSVTFEVEDMVTDLKLDDDDDDEIQGLDVESYTASYYSQKVKEGISRNPATIEELTRASADFLTGTFSDLVESMTSIHEKDLVMKQVVKPGTGRKIPENSKIFVHYVAICEGADEPFDSTVLRKAPAVIDLRKADILPGLYLAIRSMELHEVSKFIMKPSLCYGEVGCPPRVPPSSDILYIVEVLQIIDEQMLKSPLFMTAEERAALPFKQILEVADQLRTDGNGHYTDCNYLFAVKKYRKAVSVLEDYHVVSEEDEDKRSDLLHTIYANLAQCFLQLERPAQACTACKLGLKSAKGKHAVKLLYRFARAKVMLNDAEAALKHCSDGLKLDPRNSELLNLQSEATLKLNRQIVSNKKMYQNMFQK
ncbi:Inactive peptidyl-prolyl cis-trans isomerase FKBP6 [Orchesella cincta]|uniref:peptidylprolyl isomerase n=1 Tax=Orchesella cincta TaxID=48709 RepID=A0A1D2NHF0_ORCCI|nr:Inactive peptidyl-prolyl cis-trans isomerase FKBP6 [Orchesella cincta]